MTGPPETPKKTKKQLRRIVRRHSWLICKAEDLEKEAAEHRAAAKKLLEDNPILERLENLLDRWDGEKIAPRRRQKKEGPRKRPRTEDLEMEVLAEKDLTEPPPPPAQSVVHFHQDDYGDRQPCDKANCQLGPTREETYPETDQ
jgi:hypothetical protein